tara:strand:- start:1054 stop:1689 length:636 start_codon:yes stop_codon:yes gene_type:complete
MSLKNEIEKLQRRVGVVADGIIGPVTVGAILTRLTDLDRISTTLPLKKMGRKMEGFEFDARSEKNLATLSEEAQRKFRPFLAEAQAAIAAEHSCQYVLISGFRSYERQDALYAQGRTKEGTVVTNARGGYSNHNFGIAGDCGAFKGRRYLDGSQPELAKKCHELAGKIAKKHGLEWGGDWKRKKDYPHFELKTGLTMAQKRDKVRSGEWAV